MISYRTSIFLICHRKWLPVQKKRMVKKIKKEKLKMILSFNTLDLSNYWAAYETSDWPQHHTQNMNHFVKEILYKFCKSRKIRTWHRFCHQSCPSARTELQTICLRRIWTHFLMSRAFWLDFCYSLEVSQQKL